MAATGLSSRRAFLAFAAAALQAADDSSTLDLLTKLAARLSDGNSTGAIDPFSKNIPGYGDVVRNLDALASQYEIICTIEIREEFGDEAHRKTETEWFLQLKSKQQDGPTARRNSVVRIETQRASGKWRITSMEPRTLLDPPQVQ